jgi:hypothetical protein
LVVDAEIKRHQSGFVGRFLPEQKPESREAIFKEFCPPDSAEALEVMNLWRKMRLRSK